MHTTFYILGILGETQPVFVGDVTCIPETGQRVMVEERTYIVESIRWSIKGGTISVFVYIVPVF